MITSDVISRVRSIAGDTSALQFSDADVINWINDGVRECASANNLLQKTASQAVTAGVGEYALPSDIFKLHSIKYDGVKIRTTTLQAADEEFTLDDSQGNPSIAYVWAGLLNIYPFPDNSTKILQVMYTRTPIDVTDGTSAIDLPVMYHQRIVDYCLAQIYQQDDNNSMYQLKMQEFRTGVQELKDQPEWEYDQYPMISVSSRDMGDGYYDDGSF